MENASKCLVSISRGTYCGSFVALGSQYKVLAGKFSVKQVTGLLENFHKTVEFDDF